MSSVEIFVLILTIAILLPPVVYFCVKLGTYGHLRAIYIFYREVGKEKRHGDSKPKDEEGEARKSVCSTNGRQ